MKIGFLCAPLIGHLNPMTTLARKLQSRGSEVVFLGVPDVEPIARAANLKFFAFCEEEYPLGSAAKVYGPVAHMHGIDVVRYTAQNVTPGFTKATLEHLPAALAETGVDALLIDTIYRFTELVPISLGMPYVHIINILPIDRSGVTPAGFFSWPHETTPEALARNKEGARQIGEFFGPALAVAKSYAEEKGLQIDWSDPGATVSKWAVITQVPREFDFEGVPWPPSFRYAGPFHDEEGRKKIPFAWGRLTGAPLFYASLGTLVNGLDKVYRIILETAREFPEAQLVLSVGNNVDLDDMRPFPSNAMVVNAAPQIELLKRAALCITHAGLNTALEALAQGVPMVAIPIGYDQPGVAARIAHHGVGEFIEVEDLTIEGLSELIQKVLDDPGYRERASYFQKVIAETRGLDLAADVIEQAFRR